jgi:hypothetical protein
VSSEDQERSEDEGTFVLHCCLCLHSREGVAAEAVTIMNGQAVCYDHMGYVQGGAFSAALAAVLRR